MNLLINSYWCCPGMSSEPGVAWNYIAKLAERHVVTVVTGSRYKNMLLANSCDSMKFIFVNNEMHEVISAFGARFGLGAMFGGLYHYYWQIKAFFMVLCSRSVVKKNIDVFHHLNSFSWRWPPLLVLLFPKSVWGPIGGGQSIPGGLLSGRGFYLNHVRPVLQRCSRYDPILWLCAAFTSSIICANSDTFDVLPKWAKSKAKIKLETSIDCGDSPKSIYSGKPYILTVGNLIAWKGFDLLIKAMVKIVEQHPEATLVVVGDGVERSNLEALASRLGVFENVEFVGRVPYQDVKQYYQNAMLYMWGSLQDTSGNVLLEAMAAGLPVVGVDAGGTRDVVENFHTGFKVPPSSEKEVVEGLAGAASLILSNPQLRKTLAANGRRRVEEEYSWSSLIRYIENEYETV